MKKIITHLAVLLIAVAVSTTAHAQITVTNGAPYNTATYLVNNVFLGNGVTATNVTSYGAAMQIGFFDNGLAAIGIDSGIVMSSGNIASVPPGGPWPSTNIPNGFNQGAGDADLLQLAQTVPGLISQNFQVTSSWDAAKIEFDFTVLDDTITFNYCFGSEEYLTWINTQYNDAFGFFVSGPGMSGPYSNNAIQIAEVPNTNPALPITISTIHPNLNGQYYNSGNVGIQYNGFTDVFTAELVASVCNVFHIKLAISDCGDGILDTGIFLEGGSFGGGSGITINAQPSYQAVPGDTNLWEGCGDVTLQFSRSDTDSAYVVHFDIYGTAVNGVDYTFVPDSVEFLQGQTDAFIVFQVMDDGLVEGVETIIFNIQDTNIIQCNQTGDSVFLYANDQPLSGLSLFGDTIINCTEDSVPIGIDSVWGLGPHDFLWSTGQTTDQTFKVKPIITTPYFVTMTNYCQTQTVIESVTVQVITPPFATSKVGDLQTISCISDSVTFAVVVDTNWLPGMQFQWSTGQTDSVIKAFSYTPAQYTVTITLPCSGQSIVETFNLNVYNDPVIISTQDISANAFVCPGDEVEMEVEISGGYPPYTINWSSGGTDTTEKVSPLYTEVFTVSVTDVCGLTTVVEDVLVNVPVPDSLEIWGLRDSLLKCKQNYISFGPPIGRGGAGPGTYRFTWNDWQDTNPVITDEIFKSTSYTVKMTDVCNFDTVSFTVNAFLQDNDPLELFVEGDTICPGEFTDIVATAVGGGGEYNFLWNEYLRGDSLKVSPKRTRDYLVRLYDNCDTNRFDTVSVVVKNIKADFVYEYVNDYQVQFTDKSTSIDPITKYTWNFTDGTSADKDPLYSFSDGRSRDVILEIENEYGCIDTAHVLISPTLYIYIPSGFSPNGDGINDKFGIGSLGIAEFKIEIYNRWGQVIFSSRDADFQWDGKFKGERVQMGSYAYKINAVGDDGRVVERTGTLTIINDFHKR